jgi:hypothetical protein
MTPAERALLLAVAKAHVHALGPWNSPIYDLIAAVEVEAAPKPTEADVCPTCDGSGEHTQANSGWKCADCDGTGKKEKTDDHP